MKPWQSALMHCESEKRVTALADMWREIPKTERADALAEAISGGDAMYRERAWLIDALAEIRFYKQKLFDCDQARVAFAALPERIEVYRGTVKSEPPKYGICWTLDRDKARWFATVHGRFRNKDSPPIILCAVIAKNDASGFMVEREESEVLIMPEVFKWRRRPRCVITEQTP